MGGDNTGWSYVTRARNTELGEDIFGNKWKDKWFSPFISAGFSEDERDDMRPGQYLGFLKAVDLLGVDFFVPGYYRETTQPADWGRSYCWQMATPVYAQALNSRTFDFFENGYLLNGDVPWNLADPNPSTPGYRTAYRFSTTKPDELVVARKMNNKALYLLTGTLQATSGFVGAFGLSNYVEINLKDTGSSSTTDLDFNIRRQGSTYIYDNTDASHPAFWQIDKWHQYEHPERWSKDFDFEAEVPDNIEASCTKNPLPGVTIKTVDNTSNATITNDDFTNFTSYVSFETPSPLEYRFQPRNDGVDNVYTFFIRARNADTTNASISGLSLSLMDLTSGTTYGNWKINCINSADWNWYGKDECSGNPIRFSDLINEHQYVLSIVPATTDLEIDRIYLAAPNTTFAETALSPCSTYTYSITDDSQPQSASTVFGSDSVAHSTIYLAPDVILNIDDNFTFENCIFTMGGNNYIIVTGANNLSLINCNIHACNEMWNDLRTSGGSTIVCQGTSVEDAMTAIRLIGHDHADINHSLFCKNWNDFALSNTGSVNVNNSIFDYPKPFLTLPDPMIDLDPTHISASSVNLDIQNSTFRNSSLFSIFVGGRTNVVIEGCSFQGNKQAFTYSNPVNGANVSFKNNKIKSAYEDDGNMKGQYGIAIWGSTNNDINFNITNNSITDYTRPVLVMNIDNAANTNNVINENHLVLTRTVEQLGSDDYRGIKIVNSTGIALDSNSIAWTNNPDDGFGYGEQVQGIRLEDSKDAVVSENLIEKTGAAITVQENCSGIKFKCNTMSKCGYAVYLDSSGMSNILSPQTDQTGTQSFNNQWLDIKNVPDHFKVVGMIDPNIFINWLYNSNDSSAFSPSPISTTLSFNIFAVPCSTSIGCAAPNPIMLRIAGDSLTPEIRDSLFGDAVGDSAYFNTLDLEFLYHAKLAFFEAVREDSTILYLGANNDSVYIAAYDSLKQSNIGLTVKAKEEVEKGDFAKAKTVLEEIANPNAIESNMKFTLETYMNYYMPTDSTDSASTTSPPDSSTFEQMNEGASLHPFYGGKAVYLLQGLLHKDIEAKLPQQRIRTQPVEHKQVIKDSFSGKIYPNPSSGIVNYNCTINKDEKAVFTLSNTVGSEITKTRLLNSSNSIDIHSVNPGIYFYLVTINGKIKDKGKLIITK